MDFNELNKYQKARVIAATATAIISLAILLLLLNVCLSRMVPEFEEGLEVMMGATDAGGDDLFEPAPAEDIAQELQEVATSEPEPSDEAYQTQDLEQSVEMKDQKSEEQKQREKEANEKRKKEAELKEAERKRLAEEKRLKEEQQRRQDSITNAIAQRTQGLRGGGGQGSEASKGVGGTTSGSHGNPFGSNTSKSTNGASNTGNNNSFSLAGRSPIGNIALPTYSEQVEGRIVIRITVDKNGNITDAQMTKGTTVDNTAVINAAIAAAKRTKFNSIAQDKPQVGVITYDLKLK